jgi:hypothetical protein
MNRYVRPALVPLRVRHVSGPKSVEYGSDEVLAVCVVRDGELHIHSFLRHHFRLGVKHVVLLLNKSVDRTAELAGQYPNVTILRTNCPYARYENHMSRYLVRRFCRQDRWHLNLDIDELFDYPYSDDLPLGALLGYLNGQGYNAVLAQMLDMFADGPVAAIRNDPEDQLRVVYPFYDISAVRKEDYLGSTLSNVDVKKHRDGIRSQVFGTQNILTKAPLAKLEANVYRVDTHHIVGATVADFTAVLLHFPFVGTFRDKVADAVATRQRDPVSSLVYEQYLSALRRHGDALSLRRDSARRLEDLASLLDDGFLVAGPTFRQWQREYAAARSST